MCSAHCIDLILKDLAKLPWVKPVVEKCKDLVLFFKNHQKALSTYAYFSELKLVAPSSTRFATNFLMMARLLEVKASLRQAVTSPMWCQFFESSPRSVREKGEEIELRILDMSKDFWAKIEELKNLFSPIVRVLRLVDGPLPTTGKIWMEMKKMRECVQESLAGDEEKRVEVFIIPSTSIILPIFQFQILKNDKP